MKPGRGVLDFMIGTGALSAVERIMGTGGIVGYHAVTPEPLLPTFHISVRAFREQVEFLAHHYTVIPLEEFVKRRATGRSLRRCVSITFDDAYMGVLQLALPVLERLALPATVFVVSGHSATGATFWWDRLGWIMLRASPEDRARALLAATGSAQTPAHRVLPAVLERGGGRFALSAEDTLEECERGLGPTPLRPLTEVGLTELSRSRLIDFGCHTVSHPALPYLTAEGQVQEISDCSDWLRARLPRVRPYVAFPHGLYSRTTLAGLGPAGMEAGFSYAGRAATSRCDLAACPRIGLTEESSVVTLRTKLTWAAIPVIALRNREWHPRLPFSGGSPAAHPPEALDA